MNLAPASGLSQEPRHVSSFPGVEDETIAGAEASLGRSPEERWEIFCSIQRLVGAIWRNFSEEEMLRRLEIAEKIDPRPDSWWKDIKPEGLP